MGVTHNDISPTNKGTTRLNRLSEKLLPDYFKVDERNTSDFLALISEYSRHIPFPSTNEKTKSGEGISWQPFFSQDISVVLASMSRINLEKIDEDFENSLQSAYDCVDEKDRIRRFGEIFEILHKLALRFLDWYEQVLMATKPGNYLEEKVKMDLGELIRQNMTDSILKINDISEKVKKSGLRLALPSIPLEKYPYFKQFSNPLNGSFDPFKGERPYDRINSALLEIRFIYRAVYNSLAYVVSHFPKYYEQSLEEKNDHNPHVALFIAFLNLFQFTLEEINSLTGRHLDFYFRKILQQEPLAARSDLVNVLIKLSPNFQSLILPKGTLLLAGRDADGDEILYETLEFAELNHAEIVSLKSIFVSKILEGQTWTYKLVTNLYAAQVANSKNGSGENFDEGKKDWSLFGEEQYKSGVQTMSNGEVGFAISSPMFNVSEGNRAFKVHLEFSEESTEIFEKLLRDFKATSSNKKNKDEDFKYAFFEVFGNGANAGFQIFVSSKAGWLNLGDIAPNEIFIESNPWAWNKFTVGFMVPASAPPLVPLDHNSSEGKNFDSHFPVVRFVLNPDRTPFLYSFLDKLELNTVVIDLEVDRLKSLRLYNDIGRLDASQPFQAFGPAPSLGSYMLVGHSELFRNKLTEIKFTVDWQNLPPAGFADYYKEFFPKGEPGLSEEMFKINLTALSGNEFKPNPDESTIVFNLFNEGKKYSIFNVDKPELLSILTVPDLPEVNHYDNNTQAGFFKFELSSPQEAFCHHIFQERFAEIAQENADMDNEEKSKYPNPPYTPLVKGISLGYKATETIKLETVDPKVRTKIYHIYPFGSAPIFERGRQALDTSVLLPQFEEDGYLFIGLKDLSAPQEISILFQLIAGETVITQTLPEIKWSYLSGNFWTDLKESQLLADTTEGFTKTGIVRLRIPGGISQYNELMPNGVYWLRVAIKGNPADVSRALDIRTQAVVASWVDNGKSERLKDPLPAFSISDLRRKIPQVKGVKQPYPSFDGLPAESQDEFFNRVSERLRHKGRAITQWDYERMVLSQFHTISQVKASSHLTDPQFVDPGKVRVIVVPGRNHSSDILTPKVNHSTLHEVRNYLKANSSPFVDVNVSNPVYEFVRVNFKVKFVGGANNGYNLERLKNAIKEQICPWLENPEDELSLGGNIEVEELYNYIKNLPYVQFITAFAVLHFFMVDEETGEYSYTSTADPRMSKEDKEFIRSTKPWSVLIPDEDHEITFIDKEVHMPAQFSLRPVDFQAKFQITPKLIKIKIQDKSVSWEQKLAYDQNDSFEINI
ncbi:MAG: baseplate J/gp47 family protein [Bacteroidia bacterium]|nr:baseplate J/gp47 family protein [Bacteroidia bacterium]